MSSASWIEATFPRFCGGTVGLTLAQQAWFLYNAATFNSTYKEHYLQ